MTKSNKGPHTAMPANNPPAPAVHRNFRPNPGKLVKRKDAAAPATSPAPANDAARAEALKRLTKKDGPIYEGEAYRPDGKKVKVTVPRDEREAPVRPAKGAKAKAAKPGKSEKPAKAPAKAKPPRLSALDAAAQVLAASDKPLRAKDLIEQMEAKKLWKSPGGKTPEATLYAAMLREIAAKKSEARFKKVERGLFIATATAKQGA